MRKIKVLHFPIANSKGGITQYALQTWKFIDKNRFQFEFATMSKNLDFAEDLEREGCKIYYISCYAEEDEKRFVEEFRRILTEGNYDVVHLHTKQWKSFHVEQIAKEVGIRKIIVHAHSSGIDTVDEKKRQEEGRLHEQMKTMLSENTATDYWACSERAAEFLFGERIPKHEVLIMKNAIDLKKFRFDSDIRNNYRKKLGIEDKMVIGNVGRFAYPKNQEFLLEVFCGVCKVVDNCILLLIGSGDKEQDYRQYVQDNGLSDKVLFLGQRRDVHCLLQAMDVFTLTSEFEGFPLAMIEAQASGLICLCSDTVTKEIKVTDYVRFLSLEKEAWEKAILQSTDLYKREDSIEKVRNAGYDIELQIKKIEEQYEKKDV